MSDYKNLPMFDLVMAIIAQLQELKPQTELLYRDIPEQKKHLPSRRKDMTDTDE